MAHTNSNLVFLVLVVSSFVLGGAVTDDDFNEDMVVILDNNFTSAYQYGLRKILMSTNPCSTGNPIDDCWRCDSNWMNNRQKLANCAIGYGSKAAGGKDGEIYIVTDNGDDAQNPANGTLRWGVIQTGPLWITFAKDMKIALTEELLISSYKTIDGRGADVHIQGGACLTLLNVQHVIVHGISIHDCKVAGPAHIRISPKQVISRGKTDGDAMTIKSSNFVWVDHNYLANAVDGLVDIVHGSTFVTVSNNMWEHHNKVMLLGSSDDLPGDKDMRVTVAYNHFGADLIQRMPRCRFGVFHVFNNYYEPWGLYAVGGSSEPTILSEGNVFNAPDNAVHHEVTKRMPKVSAGSSWNWASHGDAFFNGAKFTTSGAISTAAVYSDAKSFNRVLPSNNVKQITKFAGPIAL